MDISKACQIIETLNKFSPEELNEIEDSRLVELTGISKKDIIDEIINLMQQLEEINLIQQLAEIEAEALCYVRKRGRE